MFARESQKQHSEVINVEGINDLALTFSIDSSRRPGRYDADGLCLYEVNGQNSGHWGVGHYTTRQQVGFHDNWRKLMENRSDLISKIAAFSNLMPRMVYFELEKVVSDAEFKGYLTWRKRYASLLGENLVDIENVISQFLLVPIFAEANANPFWFELLTRDKISFNESGLTPEYARLNVRDVDKSYPEDMQWIVKPRFGLQSRGVFKCSEKKLRRMLARGTIRLDDFLVQEYVVAEDNSRLRILVDVKIKGGKLIYKKVAISRHTNSYGKVYSLRNIKHKLFGSISRVAFIDKANEAEIVMAEKLATDILIKIIEKEKSGGFN